MRTIAVVPFRYSPKTHELADLAAFCVEEFGDVAANRDAV